LVTNGRAHDLLHFLPLLLDLDAMEEWKGGFKVMTDRVQCKSLFEQE